MNDLKKFEVIGKAGYAIVSAIVEAKDDADAIAKARDLLAARAAWRGPVRNLMVVPLF